MNSFSQTQITLKMNQLLGDKSFVFNESTTNNNDVPFSVKRMQYYVSQISLMHDGGKSTDVTDLYLLIDPSKDSTFDLGSRDITKIESIKFFIGVDEDKNHADPAAYAASHALAPKSPSMHWGWSSGYRFAAFEGRGGASLNTTFELHALGDDNYYPIQIPLTGDAVDNKLNIVLNADYTRLLENIDVSKGLVVHGDYSEAKQMLGNFRDFVFTNESDEGNVLLSSRDLLKEDLNIQIFPSPSVKSQLQIRTDLNKELQIQIFDQQGRLMMHDSFQNHGNWNTDLSTGVYVIRLYDDHSLIKVQNWIVL
jgi:hypothetical protein